jgi:hypothetical protein
LPTLVPAQRLRSTVAVSSSAEDDPVYKAAVANLQEQQRRAQANYGADQTSTNAMLNPGLADIGQKFQRSQRDLMFAQEGRGVLRSGETDTRVADLTGDRLASEGQLRTQIADRLSGLDRTLADTMGQLAGQRTTAYGDAQARKSQRDAQLAAEQRAYDEQQRQAEAQRQFQAQAAAAQRKFESERDARQEAERERQSQAQLAAQRAAQAQAAQQAQAARAQQAADNAIDPQTGLTVASRRMLEQLNPGLIQQLILARQPKPNPIATAKQTGGAVFNLTGSPLNYTAGGRRITAS